MLKLKDRQALLGVSHRVSLPLVAQYILEYAFLHMYMYIVY